MKDYTRIATFPSRLEAETVGHALDSYKIPFLIQSDEVGLFGTGHAAHSPGGAELWVPANAAEEVRRLLPCVSPPPPSPDAGS